MLFLIIIMVIFIFICYCRLVCLQPCLFDGYMDDLRYYVPFNSISVISGQLEEDNERLCAIEIN